MFEVVDDKNIYGRDAEFCKRITVNYVTRMGSWSEPNLFHHFKVEAHTIDLFAKQLSVGGPESHAEQWSRI